MKKISILGSTGSIGLQALDVVRKNPDKYSVVALAANRSIEKIKMQIEEFSPKLVAIFDEKAALELKKELGGTKTVEILSGIDGLKAVASFSEAEVVITSVVGMIGLIPTIEAIKAKKTIALANKETLVTAGEIVMNMAREYGVDILPVDSEHSAVFQSMQGLREKSQIEKIILTASGGPFRGKTKEDLLNVTKNEALKHPNWSMGQKISIDSSTLMNKGLEVIEAKWLFDVEPKDIEVVIHPQSIIHSMVQYIDGSIIAQLGAPDMRGPIQYALTYPDRIKSDFDRVDFQKLAQLTFEKPDLNTFPCLELAYEALKQKGTACTVLNAANEVLVEYYLKDKIGFYDIPLWIENAMKAESNIKEPTLEEILEVDKRTREFIIQKLGKG